MFLLPAVGFLLAVPCVAHVYVLNVIAQGRNHGGTAAHGEEYAVFRRVLPVAVVQEKKPDR